jgi:hypothetical protein
VINPQAARRSALDAQADCAKNAPISSADPKVGMRSLGEAEIAIEQEETRYEGVAWTTRRQIRGQSADPAA